MDAQATRAERGKLSFYLAKKGVQSIAAGKTVKRNRLRLAGIGGDGFRAVMANSFRHAETSRSPAHPGAVLRKKPNFWLLAHPTIS